MLSSKNLLVRSLKRTAAASAKHGGRSSHSVARPFVAPTLQQRRPQQQPARAFSWDTSNPENLFKLTSQALIHDISLHQMETVKTVVPWFLTNMPVRV
jgi:hypothetical protein